jgi:hypothetical protein
MSGRSWCELPPVLSAMKIHHECHISSWDQFRARFRVEPSDVEMREHFDWSHNVDRGNLVDEEVTQTITFGVWESENAHNRLNVTRGRPEWMIRFEFTCRGLLSANSIGWTPRSVHVFSSLGALTSGQSRTIVTAFLILALPWWGAT